MLNAMDRLGTMFRTLLRLNLALCAITACVTGDGGESATVTDSAGIRIVTSHARQWKSGGGWRLSERPILEIGTEGDSLYELGNIIGLARLSEGSVVIAMRRPHMVRMYDSTGRYVRNIGRVGQGPGEYEQPQTLIPMAGDSILIPDLGPSSVFSRAGGIGVPVSLSPVERNVGELARFPPVPDFVFGDGSIGSSIEVYNFRPRTAPAGVIGSDSTEVLRFSRDGKLLNSFGVFDAYASTCDGQSCYMQIAGLFREFAAGPDRLFTGDGATFEIRAFELGGRLVQIVRLARPGIPFTADSVDKRLERVIARDPARAVEMRNLYRKSGHRDTLPHFSELIAGSDGTLWVGEYATNFEPTRWQIFDRDGFWLGTIDLPPRFVLDKVYADAVLGRARDEFDVEQVRLYRLVK
jgi:hypothetical protein